MPTLTDAPGPTRRSARITALIVACVIASLVAVSVAVRSTFNPVTNPARYPQQILALRQQNVFSDCPAVAVLLPPALPTAATDIQFLYLPGFGQGGDRIAIRYRLPASDLAAVESGLLASGLVESAATADTPFGVPDTSGEHWSRPDPASRVYVLRPGTKGAVQTMPGSTTGGIDFFCAIDPAGRRVSYYVGLVK